MLVLPLFAMMTAEQQSRVFKDAPKGKMMCLCLILITLLWLKLEWCCLRYCGVL